MFNFFRGMLILLFSLVRWAAKGIGFMAGKGIEASTPKPRYVQGLGGPDYNRQVKPNKAMTMTEPKQVDVRLSRPADAPLEPDSLVLRTAMDSIDLDQLQSREPMPVAARVILIPLEAQTRLPIGKAWIYLYEQEKKARRVLKIQNAHLAKVVWSGNEDRFYFKDVEYNPEKGTTLIVEQFVGEIQALLNRKKVTNQVTPVVVKAQSIAVAEQRPPTPVPQPVVPPIVTTPVVVAPTPKAPVPQVNRSVKGRVYKGVVVSAAPTNKQGREGTYQTFCLTIHDGEREIPLNGAEIERQVRDMGIRVGEEIQVVDMGKTPVTFHDPKSGQLKTSSKNLYQVTRIGENG